MDEDVCLHPVAASHASVVHGLASSHPLLVPAWHTPALLHLSPIVQTLPSSQTPPVWMLWLHPLPREHASKVQ